MGVCAHDQGGTGRSRADELVSHTESVNEPGAHCLHVEGGASLYAEARLQPAGGRGIYSVRCSGANDDEIELLRIDLRGIDRRQCGLLGEVNCAFEGLHHVTLAYAGSFPNPFVTRIEMLGQLRVGHHLPRVGSYRCRRSDCSSHRLRL